MRALVQRGAGWCVCLLGASWCALGAGPETAPPPRKIVRTPAEELAKAYRTRFERVGRAGLADLTGDKDTSLALQASWEIHKKVVPRAERVVGGGSDTYDTGELKKFLGFLTKRTKAPVPEWWAKVIVSLEVCKEHHHLTDWNVYHVPKKEGEIPIPETKTIDNGVYGWCVRNEVTLAINGVTVTYKAGDVSFAVQKADLGFPISNALADAPGPWISCLAPYTASGGFEFPVHGFDSKSGKRLWSAKSWATGRMLLRGPSAGHRVELVVKGETAFVFGAELGGAYTEGFDLKTGECRFRFSTSYWDQFSEQWDIR